MLQWFQELLHSLVVAYSAAMQWLLENLDALARHVWSGVLDAAASVLEAIPVPAWFSEAPNWVGGIPPAVVWFLSPFELGTGLGIVMAAWVIRFLIRRLPIVG